METVSRKITRLAARTLIALLRHRIAVWCGVAAVLLMMIFSAARYGRYSNDLGALFPRGSLSGNWFEILRRSGLSETVQLELDSGAPGGAAHWDARTAALADRLRAVPGVVAVDCRIAEKTGESLLRFSAARPGTARPVWLREADPERAVRAARRSLVMFPGPQEALRTDPFGWRGRMLKPLLDFRELAGMRISTDSAFWTDETGARRLMNLTVRFPRAPAAGDIEALLRKIRVEARNEFPEARITLVSPLLHSLENERIVRRDILAVSLGSTLALLVLFWAVYRGKFDAFWIPALPLAASVTVTGILAVTFDRLYLFILGVGGGIVGLAVDQGIHVYASFAGTFRVRRTARLFIPLLLSVGTSALVFLATGLAGIGAYWQLGVFAAATLMLNFLLSFFLLPTLPGRRDPLRFRFVEFQPSPRTARWIVAVWIAVSVAALARLPGLRTDFRITALDGTPAAVLADEQAFQQRWRRPDAGEMLLVSGRDADAVLARCSELRPVLAAAGASPVFNPADLTPDAAAGTANRAAWNTPETRARLAALRRDTAAACRRNGLPENFFEPFFSAMAASADGGSDSETPEPAFIREVLDRTVRPASGGHIGLIFLRLDASRRAALIERLKAFPDCAFVSPEAFREAARTDYLPRFRTVLWGALGLLALLLAATVRPLAKTAIVLLPGATALLWCAGAAAALGFATNMISCFSAVLLTGLVLDYGILAVYRRDHGSDTSVPTAIFLSAVTTLFTTGALLFSRHPVLFHTGVVLFSGILVTALTALYGVPALLEIAAERRRRRRSGSATAVSGAVLTLLLAAGLCGCVGVGVERFPERTPDRASAVAEWRDFAAADGAAGASLWTLRLDIWWHRVPMLLAVRKNPASRTVSAVGMSPSGMELFRCVSVGGRETSKSVSEMIPDGAAKRVFGNLGEDLARIFLTAGGPWEFGDPVGPTPLRRGLADGEIQELGGCPLRMVQKYAGQFPFRRWRATYSEWNPAAGRYGKIEYVNYRTGCVFTLRTRNQEQRP